MIKNIMKNIGAKEVAKDKAENPDVKKLAEQNEKFLNRRNELIAKGKLSPEESKEMKDITEKVQHNTSLMLNGGNSAKDESLKYLLELEKERRSKTDSLEDNKIRLKQADLLEPAGFNTRAEFDKYLRENETAE